MSPKTATIMWVAVLLLSFTSLTLSLAVHSHCPAFDSVPDILIHYDLPPGLFPKNVQHYRCDPINIDVWRLSIRLHGACNVTKELFGVGNTVMCQPDISATVSYRHLSGIEGVTVTLTFQGKPIGELMRVTEAKVFYTGLLGKVLQFSSDKGKSPEFPVVLIQEPPTCDRPRDAAVDDSGSAAVVAAKDNQDDVPVWVYKYGRLLPFVAA